MFRCQVPEENHRCCDQWDLAVCQPVGSVSCPGLGQLWAGAIWTCLLHRLDQLWGVTEPLHLHHDPVCTLHLPPLSGHPRHLFWHRLEAAQGVPIHPEHRFSVWEYWEENHSRKLKPINAFTVHKSSYSKKCRVLYFLPFFFSCLLFYPCLVYLPLCPCTPFCPCQYIKSSLCAFVPLYVLPSIISFPLLFVSPFTVSSTLWSFLHTWTSETQMHVNSLHSHVLIRAKLWSLRHVISFGLLCLFIWCVEVSTFILL